MTTSTPAQSRGQARAETTRRLAALELPDCFAAATVAAAARETTRSTRNRTDARRLARHVDRLLEKGAL